MSASFLWFDLETFGRDPRRSRIAQFAALRTDADLQPLGEPMSLYCAPADDLLPSPDATLITGITPQQARRDGLIEAEFFARLAEELSQPGTCAVGYNSIRFDDEFLRYGLYRNFYDPYEREWKHGNSRWDLLDVLRMARALRPEGLVWPEREDGGGPSFRLEHLAVANDCREGLAHEALSDVRALLALARKLRAAQPKLWDYALRLRDKRHVASLLDVAHQTPVLHVSQRFPASRLCSALVVPIARHPKIDSRVIVADLRDAPGPCLGLDADEIADRLFTPRADLPDGEERLPLKEVHCNRCPILVPLAHLRDEDFQRLGIDREANLHHAAEIAAVADLPERLRQVFGREREFGPADADGGLYDGFIGDSDKRLFPQIRRTPAAALAHLRDRLQDARLRELLPRYQARNWPESLTPGQRREWDVYRRRRLAPDSGLSEYDFDSFRAEIAALRAAHPPGPTQALLDQLAQWGDDLERGLQE